MDDPPNSEINQDARVDYTSLNTDAMRWVCATVAPIGLFTAVSSLIFEPTEAATRNNALVGAGIFLLAGYNVVLLGKDRLANVGVATLTAVLGLWLIISPPIIGMENDVLMTGTVLSGVIAAALSAYTAYTSNKTDTTGYIPVRP